MGGKCQPKADKGGKKNNPVAIALRLHLFPYRTQKLSSIASMVLGGRPPGRVERCRICSLPKLNTLFFARALTGFESLLTMHKKTAPTYCGYCFFWCALRDKSAARLFSLDASVCASSPQNSPPDCFVPGSCPHRVRVPFNNAKKRLYNKCWGKQQYSFTKK